MATPTNFATYLDAIATAIANGDVATARLNYRQALTVLPQLASAGADGTTISYGQAAEALKMLRAEINTMSSGAVIFQPVEFAGHGGSSSL